MTMMDEQIVARLVSACTGNNRAFVQREAEKVIAYLLTYMDRKVADEAVGYCLTLKEPPVLPRYVVPVVTARAERIGVFIPPFEVGR